MDGSTVAAKDCFILSCIQAQSLYLEYQDDSYSTIRLEMARLATRGILAKKWILIPMNFNNSHWGCVALLNPFHLGDKQGSGTLTGYFYYNPDDPDSTRLKEFEEMRVHGILNFLVLGNLEHGSPPMLGEGRNLQDYLNDPNRFARFVVDRQDFVRQGDDHSCGIYAVMFMHWLSTVVAPQPFVEGTSYTRLPTGDFKVFQGGFMKTFINPDKSDTTKRKKKSKDVPPEEELPAVSNHVVGIIRKQVQELVHRMHLLKHPSVKGEYHLNVESMKFPKYVNKHICELVFGLDLNNSQINMDWLEEQRQRSQKVKFLIQSSNPAVLERNPDVAVLVSQMEEKRIDNDAFGPGVMVEVVDLVDLTEGGLYLKDNNLESKADKDSPMLPPSPSKPPKPTTDPETKLPGVTESIVAESSAVVEEDRPRVTITQSQAAVDAPILAEETEIPASAKAQMTVLSAADNRPDDWIDVSDGEYPPGSDSSDTDDDDYLHKDRSKRVWRVPNKKISEFYNSKALKLRFAAFTKAGPRYYRPEQTSFEEAKAYIQSLPQPPRTKEDWDEAFQKYKDWFPLLEREDYQKLGFKSHIKYMKETAKLLEPDMAFADEEDKINCQAELYTYDGITGIRYNTVADDQDHQKGNFIVRTKSGRELVVSRGWVAKNFEKDAKESMVARYNNTWVDVAHKHLALTLDHSQVMKIRWNVPDTVLADPRKKHDDGHWVGMLRGGKTIQLDEAYVQQNFGSEKIHKDKVELDYSSCSSSDVDTNQEEANTKTTTRKDQTKEISSAERGTIEEKEPTDRDKRHQRREELTSEEGKQKMEEGSQSFIEAVKKLGEMHSKKFFRIPPGAPKNTKFEGNEHLPTIRYMQNGESTCLFMSLASALHYAGLTRAAYTVSLAASSFDASLASSLHIWPSLIETMKKACRWLIPIEIKRPADFDIFNDISDFPTVLQLQAADGGIQHAVTIVDCLVFDSNLKNALPLTRRALDFCCSSDIQFSTYEHVYRGYRFKEQKFDQKGRYKKIFLKRKINF